MKTMDGLVSTSSKTLDNQPAESTIDHNLLSNYEANEHIDWTNATQTLTTTGNINGDELSVGATTISGTLRYTAGTPIDDYILTCNEDGDAVWEPPLVLEDSHETTFSGLGFTTASKVIRITRMGNMVTLSLPTYFGTATVSALFENDDALPLTYRPASNRIGLCYVADNGVFLVGRITLLSSGTISIFPNLTGGWSGTGSSGLVGSFQTFTYCLEN